MSEETPSVFTSPCGAEARPTDKGLGTVGLPGPWASSDRPSLPLPQVQAGTQNQTQSIQSALIVPAPSAEAEDPPPQRPGSPPTSLPPLLRQASRSLLPLAQTSADLTNEKAGFRHGAAPRAPALTSLGPTLGRQDLVLL